MALAQQLLAYGPFPKKQRTHLSAKSLARRACTGIPVAGLQ